MFTIGNEIAGRYNIASLPIGVLVVGSQIVFGFDSPFQRERDHHGIWVARFASKSLIDKIEMARPISFCICLSTQISSSYDGDIKAFSVNACIHLESIISYKMTEIN